jgi:hypothetical protein
MQVVQVCMRASGAGGQQGALARGLFEVVAQGKIGTALMGNLNIGHDCLVVGIMFGCFVPLAYDGPWLWHCDLDTGCILPQHRVWRSFSAT